MKKIVISILAVVLLAAAVITAAAVSSRTAFEHDGVEILTAESLNISTTDRLEMSQDFYIKKETVDYLKANADVFKLFAVSGKYNEETPELAMDSGPALSLTDAGETVIGEDEYYVYRLSFGVILSNAYNDALTYRAFLSYEMLGKTYSVASDYSKETNVFVPYDCVYELYCDRSNTMSETYSYLAPDGSYAKVKDLYTMTKILTAYTYVNIEEGKAVNVKENEYYKSAISADYFDGVLTLYINGSDIPEWMIEKLYVNGEERYFEIYEGRIRLVV